MRKQDEEARLAAALRENLRRRKARARALGQTGEAGSVTEKARETGGPLAAAKPDTGKP